MVKKKKGKPLWSNQRALILEEFESVSKVILQTNDDDDSSNNAIIDFHKINPKISAIVMEEIEVKKIK